MNLEEMRERLAEVEARLAELAEPDELSDEEACEFDDLSDEHDDLRESIDQAETRRERERRRQEIRDNIDAGRFGTEDGSDPGVNVNTQTDPFDLDSVPSFGPARDRELKSRAVTAIEESTRFVSDDHRDSAIRMLDKLGGKPGVAELTLLRASETYADAFLKKMAGEELTDDERDALTHVRHVQRSLGLSDVTGVLVPDHLDPTVILSNDGTVNPFRDVSRVVQHDTNVWTGVTSAGVTASWDAEGAEVSDDAPSFSNPPVTAHKANAFVPISYEGFEDLRGNEDDIVMMIRDSKDRLESTAFATGSGSGQPTGIVTALDANTNTEVANTTSNVFGVEDVYNVYEQLPARWREQATWAANLAIINDIRQFGTDALSTQTVDLTADGVTRILGKPLVESSAMDGTIGTSGTDNILVIGEFSQYLIVDRIGLAVEFIPNLFGTTNGRPTGERGWMAHWRTGADALVDTAFRLLQAETN